MGCDHDTPLGQGGSSPLPSSKSYLPQMPRGVSTLSPQVGLFKCFLLIFEFTCVLPVDRPWLPELIEKQHKAGKWTADFGGAGVFSDGTRRSNAARSSWGNAPSHRSGAHAGPPTQPRSSTSSRWVRPNVIPTLVVRPFWRDRIEHRWRKAPMLWLSGVRRSAKTPLATTRTQPIRPLALEARLAPIGGISK